MSCREDQREPDPVEWWLCSHLVSINGEGAGIKPRTVVLEEISITGVRFAVDMPIPEATRLVLQTRDIEWRIVVERCHAREDDFLMEARLSGSRRWTPELWTPDHLYRPERKPRARSAAKT